MSNIEPETISAFRVLFGDCNMQSKGVYRRNGNMSTESEPVQPSDFERHLSGVQGLGLVPIMENSTAKWGAIDLDAHEDGREIDLVALEAEVRKLDLPLMVCRSKSGGAHLYVFLTASIPAKELRSILRGWLVQLGLPASTEIFPKQDSLQPGQKGNWINLCYFDGDEGVRYCVEAGSRVKLAYFVELAESRRVDARTLTSKSLGRHSEAPPCICKMLADGVEQGSRNDCLFHFAVYARQAFPSTWEEEVDEFNRNVFPKSLRRAEVLKVKNSASGTGYKYKCNNEYIKTLCDSGVCVKRDFGIPKSELDGLERYEMPDYGPLHRYDSDPIQWKLFIGDRAVTVSSSELRRHGAVCDAALNQLGLPVPPMKDIKWFRIWSELAENAKVIESSPEMRESDSLLQHVRDFIQNANPQDPDTAPERRWDIEAGVPCIQKEKDGTLVAIFRGGDVMDRVKRAGMRVDPTKLYKVLSEKCGGKNMSVRLPKTDSNESRVVRAWTVSLANVWCGPLEAVDIKTEF